MKALVVVLLAALLLSGCGSFWEAEGEANRTRAQAALRQAEAERQNAQAAIIDAEARGALAQSQARALTTAMDANADLTRQAVSLADNGEYVLVLALVALAALGLALVVVVMHGRRPAAAERDVRQPAVLPALKPGITIESIAGPLRIEQQPGETRYHFMVRVRKVAEAIEAAEERMLLAEPEAR